MAHGGVVGWDRRHWRGEADPAHGSLTLSRHSPAGEEGYPGDVIASVTFTVKDSSVKLSYQAMAASPTIVNITNHTYFNLGSTEDILGKPRLPRPNARVLCRPRGDGGQRTVCGDRQ